ASVRPDLLPWTGAAPDSTQAAQIANGSRVAAPRPLGEPLPFSVRVVAFSTFPAAHERLVELREQVPGVLFFITPEDIQGITYYKVMAGALPDVEVARETRDALISTGAIDAEE